MRLVAILVCILISTAVFSAPPPLAGWRVTAILREVVEVELPNDVVIRTGVITLRLKHGNDEYISIIGSLPDTILTWTIPQLRQFANDRWSDIWDVKKVYEVKKDGTPVDMDF